MSAAGAEDPGGLARIWYAHVTARADARMPLEIEAPPHPVAGIAALVELALADGHELLVLVPDDAVLPELSNALDLSIRPLCLVLPRADFAAGIALRATISLLKSRLWRDGDDSHSPPWSAMRRRLAGVPETWREARTWIADEAEDKPIRTDWTALFPALILPLAAWTPALARPKAITLLYRCDAPAELDADVARLLRLGMAPAASRSTTPALADETTWLLLERTRLTQDIADLELELASVQGELAEFMRDYYQRVARLMAEHDLLLATRAAGLAARTPEDPGLRAEAEASRARARESESDSDRFAETLAPDQAAFKPDHETKHMFRRLAQQIHPDRASDEDDRAWRTQLMSEANRAYRQGDLDSLREIAALWDEQPAGRRGADPAASQLQAQLARLRARLTGIEDELHRLFGSRLYELFIAARQARRHGRDLLDEMATRLEAEIATLRQAMA